MFPKPQRSTAASFVALIKKGVEELLEKVIKTRVFRVRVENERALTDSLLKIQQELRVIYKRLGQAPKIEVPPATINIKEFKQPSDRQLEDLSTAIKDLSYFVDTVQAKIGDIKVEVPKIQKIEGSVEVKNQSQFPTTEILSALSSIEGTLKNLGVGAKAPKIEFPEMPKGIDAKDLKKVVDGLADLKKAVEDLPKKMPEVEIPNRVSVDNWPVQKYPNPVTNININPLRGEVYSSAVTVSTSRTSLPNQTPLAYRRGIVIYNNGSATVFIGGANVTAADGMPVPGGTYSPAIDAGPRMLLYGITSSSSSDVRVLELSNENVGG